MNHDSTIAMPRRRFGRTELAMPVFTCGGMRYQHAWKDTPPGEIPADNQANLEATVQRAFDLGINHVETARGYGTSEMQLGNILPRLPREKLIVQTKVGPTAEPKEFLKKFETSMAYLKLGHVDLLSLHGINNEETLDWSLRQGGCLDAARQLQRDGRCRFIGFSTHGLAEGLRRAGGSGPGSLPHLSPDRDAELPPQCPGPTRRPQTRGRPALPILGPRLERGPLPGRTGGRHDAGEGL